MSKPPFHKADIIWRDNNVPEAKSFGDIYYSPDVGFGDGLAESEFVFLKGINAPNCWTNKNQYSIGETGFGTGLNFLATWDKWRAIAPENATLNYVSVEGFPLTRDQLSRALKPFPTLKPLAEELIANYPLIHPGFHHLSLDEGRINLTLLFGPVDKMLSEITGPKDGLFDAWFLDGFAPAKNPDMWSPAVMKQLGRLIKPQGKLATFTAAGIVKQGLEDHGFTVEKTKGFGKKRARIIAVKTSPLLKLDKCYSAPKSIAIIGAGIAGCTLAHALKQKGLNPTLIDIQGEPGAEASGNPVGIIKPQLALGEDPVARFYIQSFLHAHRFYHKIAASNEGLIVGEEGTIESIMPNEKEIYQKLIKSLNWPKDILSLVDNKNGETQFQNNWAFALTPKEATKALSKDIPLKKAKVSTLEKSGNGWRLLDKSGDLIIKADAVVVANAMAASDLLPEATLTLRARRGQIHTIPTWEKAPLKTLGFQGYFTPKHPQTDKHVLGASFTPFPTEDLGDEEKWRPLRVDEYTQMLERAEAVIPGISKNSPPMEGRANIRATTHDHMPAVGPVITDEALVNARAKKPSGWEKKILASTLGEEGLYVMTGLGSKGFQTAPLLADYLTSLITQSPCPLEKSITLALSPGRFKLWDMKRTKR